MKNYVADLIDIGMVLVATFLFTAKLWDIGVPIPYLALEIFYVISNKKVRKKRKKKIIK